MSVDGKHKMRRLAVGYLSSKMLAELSCQQHIVCVFSVPVGARACVCVSVRGIAHSFANMLIDPVI